MVKSFLFNGNWIFVGWHFSSFWSYKWAFRRYILVRNMHMYEPKDLMIVLNEKQTVKGKLYEISLSIGKYYGWNFNRRDFFAGKNLIGRRLLFKNSNQKIDAISIEIIALNLSEYSLIKVTEIMRTVKLNKHWNETSWTNIPLSL